MYNANQTRMKKTMPVLLLGGLLLATCTPGTVPYGFVKAEEGVVLLESAVEESAAVKKLPFDSLVVIRERSGEWVKAETGGKTGWLRENALDTTPVDRAALAAKQAELKAEETCLEKIDHFFHYGFSEESFFDDRFSHREIIALLGYPLSAGTVTLSEKTPDGRAQETSLEAVDFKNCRVMFNAVTSLDGRPTRNGFTVIVFSPNRDQAGLFGQRQDAPVAEAMRALDLGAALEQPVLSEAEAEFTASRGEAEVFETPHHAYIVRQVATKTGARIEIWDSRWKNGLYFAYDKKGILEGYWWIYKR